jgi:prolyl 4-hydroxylase
MAGQTAVDLAQALLERGDRAGAIATAGLAIDRGDADATFMVAIWRLIGDPLPRDLAAARVLLARARQRGHRDAALMEVALTANGTGAPADWPAALALLERAAPNDEIAAHHLALVKTMNLATDGAPRKLARHDCLSEVPRVSVFRDAFSPDECAHLAQAVGDIISPSVVVDPATGRQIQNPIRTSDGAVIGPTRESLPVSAINRRIAAMAEIDVRQGEPLQILRYAPGQQYRLHSDALPGTGNQRVATAIIYLNDGFGGGETDFPDLGIRVVPNAGDMLLFDNVLSDGRPDPRVRHAGLPVSKGLKWIATRWIRASPYDPWNASG